jgi:hypothetical protein
MARSGQIWLKIRARFPCVKVKFPAFRNREFNVANRDFTAANRDDAGASREPGKPALTFALWINSHNILGKTVQQQQYMVDKSL